MIEFGTGRAQHHTSLGSRRRLLTPFALSAALLWTAGCENPLPPISCGAISQQTIHVGESASVTACFDDPNGDILSYAVHNSDPGVAIAEGRGTGVTVTAVSPGNATVTITASDVGGLMAQQSFPVMVPNRGPVAVGEIAGRELAVGDSATIDLTGYFTEPDGQPLTFAATADSGTAVVSLAGAGVTVAAVAKGTRTVTATATDPGGLATVQSFVVTVPNRAPLAEGSVSGQTVEVGDTASMDIAPYFMDQDGDALAYSVESSDAGVIAAMVAGNMVSVAAVAKGTASVTVTATDTEGLTAAQSFDVTVPNRAPVVMESIPDRSIFVGETAALAAGPVFADPDEDVLTYAVAVLDTTVATASLAGGTVTLAAVGKGRTGVAVTATDAEGLAVTQDFTVTVPNRGPVRTADFSERTVQVDSAATVDIAPHFSDPDGDPLEYAAVTSDSTVATAAIAATAGAAVTITGMSKGQATITVTATDDEGLAVTQGFTVTVPNRAPVVEGPIEPRTLRRTETDTVDLAGTFSDPDGDELTYDVVSSATRVGTGAIAGTELTLSARWVGTTTFTVIASDGEGLTARQDFDMTVTRAPPSNNPPEVVYAPSPPELGIGEVYETELRAHFSDPDDDDLTFAAVSSDTAVAVVEISDGTLQVRIVGEGNANIAVTAADPRGGSASFEFTITTELFPGVNRRPFVIARYSDLSLSPGETVSIDLGGHFQDPNEDDVLTYGAASTDAAVAAVTISASTLQVTAVAEGAATVTATATDPGSLAASLSFAVTVETVDDDGSGAGNRRPNLTRAIPFRALQPAGEFTIDLGGHFSDPDNNALTFSATSSDPATATVAVSGSELTVTAVAQGTVTITVSAADGDGLSASHSFDVTVTADNTPPRVRLEFYGYRLAKGAHEYVFPSTHFWDDFDGLQLTYLVTSSDSTVVSVEPGDIPNFILNVKLVAKSDGDATITVSATDSHGLTTSRTFVVTVGNEPPVAKRQVDPLTLFAGEVDSIQANAYSGLFTDSDRGDHLTYSANSSNTAVVTVSVSQNYIGGGNTLYYHFKLTGKAVGESTVTLTATDRGGLQASVSFKVTVDNNRTPQIQDSFPENLVVMTAGDTLTYTLADYFEDAEDGDNLTWSASSDRPDHAAAEVSDGVLRVIGLSFTPTAYITVTATDSGGKSVSQTFIVFVNPAPSG